MRQLSCSFTIANPTLRIVGTGALPVVPGTNFSGKYQNVTVVGKYAYVAATGGPGLNPVGLSLVIYDVSNPAAPFVTSYIITQTNPWHSGPTALNGSYYLAVQNGYAYVASSASLYIVNVQNPYAPFNVYGLTFTAGSLYSLTMRGNYAYIATQNKGLTVVDCTNPSLPVQTYQEGGTLNKSLGVCVSNGYLFTTNYQTTAPWTVRYLKIWSLSNPAVPTLITTYTLPAGTKPGEVVVTGGYAYVTDYNTSSVEIVDISNVNAPNYVSSMAASATFNVIQDAATNMPSLTGNYAYIPSGGSATFGGAIDMYDITAPATPVKILTYLEGVPTSVGYQGSVLSGNLLYSADYGVGAGTASSLVIFSTPVGFTSAVSARELTSVSAQITAVDSTASGAFMLQGSDDVTNPINWSDIPSTRGAVSGAGSYLLPRTELSYQWIRLAYTNTGTGGLSVVLKALGDL